MSDESWKDAPKGDAPDFVYVIYIAADIETVWNGLMDREVTRKYWGHDNVSEWKKGVVWEHIRSDDSGVVDIRGQVLEIDPPHSLVVTWNAPEQDWAEPHPSQVAYHLVRLGPDTRLTVTHSRLDEGSVMHKGVTEGWPGVLSNLKSVLETGKALREDEWPSDEQRRPPDE